MITALIFWTAFIIVAFFYILLSLEGEDIMGAPILFLPTALLIAVPWAIYGIYNIALRVF